MKPNYSDFGLSTIMGSELRKLVEKNLKEELIYYGVESEGLFFDWSDSCIEGEMLNYLDGTVENFSGIALYDKEGMLVVDGWMEFIYNKEINFFIAYWDYISIYSNGVIVFDKKQCGMPKHVFEKIPETIREEYRKLLIP